MGFPKRSSEAVVGNSPALLTGGAKGDMVSCRAWPAAT